MAVSICTLNVNGIAEHSKREKVFKHLLDQHFDIYLLQETHLPDVTQGKLWETQWGGHALGLQAQIDRLGWAYSFALGAQLR